MVMVPPAELPIVVLAREIVTAVKLPNDSSKLGSVKVSVNGMPCCGVVWVNISVRDAENRDDDAINPKLSRTIRFIQGCKLLLDIESDLSQSERRAMTR